MTQPGKIDLSDQGLLARAMQGDTEAFGDLYTRYLDEVLRYVFYRVANRFEAEDLTETVFLKAWDALSRFESSEVNFRAWLYRIAHNITVDYYRTRQPSLEMPEVELHDLQLSPEHQLQIREQHKGLALAIQSLDDSLQQVITCRFVNGLSHAETAQIMGLKEGHVRVLQLRALQKLRLILEKQE